MLADEQKLLKVVADLLLDTAGRVKQFDLDTRLETDLGLDSLSRVELFHRIERAFARKLPEEELSGIVTLRDLLRALDTVATAADRQREKYVHRADSVEKIQAYPEEAQTLVAVLAWHAQRHPQRTHLLFLDAANREQSLSYGELLAGARSMAASLATYGLDSGDALAIMLPTSIEYFLLFFAALIARLIPVPIYPPLRASQLEDHLRRHGAILNNSRAKMLVATKDLMTAAKLLGWQAKGQLQVIAVEQLQHDGEIPVFAQAKACDVALLQYTSGSTANPKGVVLSHENLLADIRAMGRALAADSADVFVSWLPLYHDMGLIGAWLGSLYHACLLVVMSPMSFLARPENWLWAIHRYRGSLSAAPNFAFELCLSKIDDRDIEGLDLSSLRMLMNGAEPVSCDTLANFSARFCRYSLDPRALAPVYGLAECSVGLTFPPLGRGPLVDLIDQDVFLTEQRAVPVSGSNAGLRFVSVGLPLPGHQVRVVDETGLEVGDRKQGRLEFKGPAATSGYFDNPEDTRRLFHGNWLDSGDLAYIAGGEVYITGRVKDIIIKGGRNYHPYELEAAIGNIPGIRKGCVAVFGIERQGGEKIVVMAETREPDEEKKRLIEQQIAQAAVEILGASIDEIVLAPAHTVLKTSSGKIRRSDCRKLYLSGNIAASSAAWRIFLLALMQWQSAGRHFFRQAGALLTAFHIWLVFWLLAPFAWIFSVMALKPSWGWRVSRLFARIFLRASFIPLSVRGEENLPADRVCILVANHQSYLDGIILVAALPPQASPGGFFSFVAKDELRASFISRLYLRHIGARFVERFDFRRQVTDAKNLEQSVRAGTLLVFFPEGTFSRSPGLAPFKMGAFFIAAQCAVPVVPLTIVGTRSVLRDGHWFPRRERIDVTIGKAIFPEGNGWKDALSLRAAARKQIAANCGEPDLA